MSLEIKRASPVDISTLYVLLNKMHEGTVFKIAPIQSETLIKKITEVIYRGVCFITYDKNKGGITGSVGGMVGNDWWSDKPFLGDLWFYVLPEYRKTRSAFLLVKEFISFGKNLKLSIRMGHIFSGDIDKKDKFFEHFKFIKAGSTFIMES